MVCGVADNVPVLFRIAEKGESDGGEFVLGWWG
jgi:hypothetical protein